MSSVVTLLELVQRVRAATTVEDLHELQRLVGPSEEERLAAQARLAELDRLAPKCGWGEPWPSYTHGQLAMTRARERWEVVMAAQQAFENRYC